MQARRAQFSPGPPKGALNPLLDITAGIICHGQPQSGRTELVDLAGLHELRNRATDASRRPTTIKGTGCDCRAAPAK